MAELTRAEAEAEWPEWAEWEELEELSFIEEEYEGPLSYGLLLDTPNERPVAAEEAISQPGITIGIQVAGVEPLARNFETLSARAHKQLIPNVLADSVSRLNDAIVENIPVGLRGHKGDTGGWKRAQSRIRPGIVPTAGRHTTTVAAPLPEGHELGIRSGESYYPFNMEYGSRIAAALAPIRRAVHRLEHSVFGEILDLFGHGLPALALVLGPALLLRKAIFGRATPADLMPIDFSRTRGRDGIL